MVVCLRSRTPGHSSRIDVCLSLYSPGAREEEEWEEEEEEGDVRRERESGGKGVGPGGRGGEVRLILSTVPQFSIIIVSV